MVEIHYERVSKNREQRQGHEEFSNSANFHSISHHNSTQIAYFSTV